MSAATAEFAIPQYDEFTQRFQSTVMGLANKLLGRDLTEKTIADRRVAVGVKEDTSQEYNFRKCVKKGLMDVITLKWLFPGYETAPSITGLDSRVENQIPRLGAAV